ncbi:MAG: hypothetical protein ACR2J6_03985 [Thermoleophilaceae bacterium]
MTTSHPRIGVTRDADLAAALDSTRPLFSEEETHSEAGHVRRLALIGARALRHEAPEAKAALDRQRLFERPGVRPATSGLDDLTWLDTEAVDRDRRAIGALEWVRGER